MDVDPDIYEATHGPSPLRRVSPAPRAVEVDGNKGDRPAPTRKKNAIQATYETETRKSRMDSKIDRDQS